MTKCSNLKTKPAQKKNISRKMLGRCGELEMPFGNCCDSAHLRALQSQCLTCQNTQQSICLGCDIQPSLMQAGSREIWNRFKTIFRNTTVPDAFHTGTIHGFLHFKSPSKFSGRQPSVVDRKNCRQHDGRQEGIKEKKVVLHKSKAVQHSTAQPGPARPGPAWPGPALPHAV